MDRLLSKLIHEKIPVAVFLLTGVKLEGVIVHRDADFILLNEIIIFKQAIATIVPKKEMEAEIE